MPFTDIFDELEPAERVALLDWATERQYDPDQLILRQDDENQTIFVVVEGQVRVERTVEREPGDEVPVVVARLGLGSIFGEMAFLTRANASASVFADEPVKVLCLQHQHLREMAQQDPNFAGRFYRSLAITLAHRLNDTNCRFSEGLIKYDDSIPSSFVP